MNTSVDVFLYSDDDGALRMHITRHGATLNLGGGFTVNWMGADGAQRAAAVFRRLLAELEREARYAETDTEP